MRRAIVTTSATVGGIVLLLGLKPHSGTAVGQTKSFSIGSGSDATQSQSGTSSGDSSSGGSDTPGQAPTTSTTTNAPTSPTTTTTTTTTAPKQTSGGTKTVTGDAADTRFGPVQLQVTFSGHKITKIDVLEYPTQSGRDAEINDYALPILNQEAMTAQNAQIDAVSGATFTSDGYVQSLQSAIDKLGA